MSFGQQEDEVFTFDLKTLLEHKHEIEKYPNIMEFVPLLTNYELSAGFVFQLSIPPFAFDVSIGDIHESLQPNIYQLTDHLNIDIEELNDLIFIPRVAFDTKDYNIINNIIKTTIVS